VGGDLRLESGRTPAIWSPRSGFDFGGDSLPLLGRPAAGRRDAGARTHPGYSLFPGVCRER